MAHVVLLHELPVPGELLVEPAERRALVAGDHRAGVKPAAAVGAVLVERQAHEALHAREEDPALLEDVLVVERDVEERAAAVPAVVFSGAPEAPGVARWLSGSSLLANRNGHPA